MLNSNDAVIQVYSGGGIDILNPRGRDFRILDIAESLSKIARFNGHTRRHVSIAQHSILVSYLLTGTGLEMEGLMHDAPEFITGDISTPMKKAIIEMVYRATGEQGIDPIKLITIPIDIEMAKQFNLVYPRPQAVKDADLEAMTLERRQFLLPASGVAWSTDVRARVFALSNVQPAEACEAFINRYNEILWGEKELAS